VDVRGRCGCWHEQLRDILAPEVESGIPRERRLDAAPGDRKAASASA
jgi:hypothetical protein